MDPTARHWKVFDEGLPILTHEYSFGPGAANALAVGGERGLIVVSPPCRARAGVFDELGRYGMVRALVAPNAYHTMGVAEWKARFPDADVYAPAQSIARLRKVSGEQRIRPIDDIQAIAGKRVRFVDMPHYRTGETLICIDSSQGLVWYVTDVILNMKSLPSHPVARWLFRVSGSAPGLRFNNIAPLFMVRDRRALRRWILAEASRQKPRWIIPAHGEIVDLEADVASARRLLAAS